MQDYQQIKYTPVSPIYGYDPHEGSTYGMPQKTMLEKVSIISGCLLLAFSIYLSYISRKTFTPEELTASPFKQFYKTKKGMYVIVLFYILALLLIAFPFLRYKMMF